MGIVGQREIEIKKKAEQLISCQVNRYWWLYTAV